MTLSPSKILDLVTRTLESEGVTLVNIDTSGEFPIYFIDLTKSKLVQSLDDTLRSTYWILWVLTYGKVSDSKRDLKIDLKYRLKE